MQAINRKKPVASFPVIEISLTTTDTKEIITKEKDCFRILIIHFYIHLNNAIIKRKMFFI